MAHSTPRSLRLGARGAQLSGRRLAAFTGRVVLVACGLWLFALGTVFTLRSSMGLSPWDTFHQGLSRHLPITLGQATIVVSLLIVLFSLLLGIRPGLGTLMNALLIGFFVDRINASPLAPALDNADLWLRIAVDVIGVLIIGVGSALYIKPRLGAGPRDSLMLAVRDRLHVRVGLARAGVELTALLFGWLLGGTVGVGTLIFALGVGPAVDLAFRLFRVERR